MKKQGFSLVELSIVLVILGLLVGGVLSGQSLIHSAELRTVTTELSTYNAATQAFRDKYFGWPGDITNATSFWKSDSNGCFAPAANPATSADGVCDGNGDGKIGLTYTAGQEWNTNVDMETFQYWRQLQKAGLITGNATGRSAPVGGSNFDGAHYQRSKMNGGYWVMLNDLTTWWSGINSHATGTNSFVFLTGSAINNIGTNMKPEDQWNIDTKIDDGNPVTGKILASDGWGGTCVNWSTWNTAGTYNVSDTSLSCFLLAANQF